MVYKELILNIDESFREDFIAELLMLNFESFTESNDALHAYIPANRWSASLLDDIRRRLKNHQQTGKINSFTCDVNDVYPQNWQEQWERTVVPVHVGKHVIIHPSWQSIDKTNDTIDVIIDPKMSFGTGHHETTQMMIELLEEYCMPGMDILDVGTGSGVLSIVAAKLGASYVAGIDNDPDSIADAQENCERNKMHNIVRLYPGKPDEIIEVSKQTFNMILANIEKKVILAIFDFLTNRLRENGVLLLSGLLQEDYPHIEKAWKNKKLSLLKRIERTSQTSDTWTAIALQK